MEIKDYIVDVVDFPQKGIVFKDITPVLNDPKVFQFVIDQMGEFIKTTKANVIVVPEARGFLFGPALAYKLGLRLVLVRKPNKLPRKTFDVSYDLEYGQGHLQIHKGDLHPNDQVVIVDDVLATGGTLKAIDELVRLSQATVVGISVLIDLKNLHPKDVLGSTLVNALVVE